LCLDFGESEDPCSDGYGGTEPFSEPEAQAIRDFMLKYNDNIKSYITLHSFGSVRNSPRKPKNPEQKILIPFFLGRCRPTCLTHEFCLKEKWRRSLVIRSEEYWR